MSPTAAARSPASATTVATAVYRVQLALFDGAATSNEPLLHAAAALLSCADYADVVSERSIASCCGHPACANALHPDPNPNPPHFRISLREHRVYDLEESRKFCSEGCLVASAAFAASLPPDRPFGVPPSRLDAVVALFEGGRNGEGLGFGADGGKEERRKVEIREKENPGEGEVTLEEWIGPPGAIDGYVPRQDRSGEGPKQKAKQNKAGRAEHSRAENATSNNTATDEDDIGILPPSVDMQEISEVIAKKLEDVALNENTKAKKKEETKSSPKTFNQDEDGNMLSSCISDSIAKQLEDVVLKEKKKATKSSSRASKTKPITKTTGSDGHEVDFTSTIIIGDHALGRTDQGIVGQHNFASFELAERQASSSKYTAVDSKQFHSEQLHDEFRKVVSLGKDETSDEKIKPALKSSKIDGSKNRSHSVRWADQNETGGDTGRNKTSESHSNDRKLPEEDKDSSLRHASAEACAAALIEATEAISSGTAAEEDAVSKAGIIILPNMSPPPQYNHAEVVEEQNIFEIDKGVVKWPKKTVLLDRDMFEVEDSWHDMPPDGFSLTLSAFATMWATLFGWVSCLSLVYIYGIDESCVEEILITNGREYPQKIVLKEGHSSEIRRALDTCVCNALPGLVSNLRLQIPVSKLEITLGYLLDTMSFVDALPSLKSRQWQVVVLVMLDALSVHRLPALAPLMTDTMLLQKVLDAAQISREEYNSMIDLFLPFGRSTQTTLHRS